MVNKDNKYDLVKIGACFVGIYSHYKDQLDNIKAIIFECTSYLGGT